MSSFIWPPDGAAQQAQAAQSYVQGQSNTGVKVGGAAAYIIPAVFVGSGGVVVGGAAQCLRSQTFTGSGGVVIGGQASVSLSLVFFTYKFIGSGGPVVGGAAKYPNRFIPDPDFLGMRQDGWHDDPDFLGGKVGGN